jgi:hypothetical protein
LETAVTEERHALAIAPSVWLGVRLTSNSIRAVRRSFARDSRELSLGAAWSAASAARSRRHTRQSWPPFAFAQESGSGVGAPSIRPADTPQPSHVHLLALFEFVLMPNCAQT